MADSTPIYNTQLEVGQPRGLLPVNAWPPTIPGFSIIREIGRGGMGAVFEAEETTLHRRVALKVMKPDLAENSASRERFLREARAQAAVEHEHVAAIHSVNEGTSSPFLVMPLLKGESLAMRLKRQPEVEYREILRIGREIADGLAAAHAKGLIHRDIKPDNIWLEQGKDRVKILDFGLARAADTSGDHYRLTTTGAFLGTPAYMAPEQAAGKSVDARVDLFSLGVILYEMASKRRPFVGDSHMAILTALAVHNPPSLGENRSDLPEPFCRLVDGLLNKNPENRLPHTAALVSTAIAILEGEGQLDAILGVPRKARTSFGELSRLLGVAILSFALGGLCVGIYGNWLSIQRPRAAVEDTSPKEWKMSARLTAAIWSLTATPDGETVIAGLEDGSVVLWDLKNSDSVAMIGQHDGPVWTTDLSVDGKILVTSSDDGTVKVWDMTTGKAINEIDNKTSVRSAALNKERTLVVTGDRKGFVRVWPLNEKSEKPTFEILSQGVINAVAFRPTDDGQEPIVASGSTNKTAMLWKYPKLQRESETLRGHKGPIYSLAFSPDGKVLATASWDHDVVLFDVDTGKAIGRVKNAHDEGIWSIAFACRGKVFATAGQEGLVKVWNIETLPKTDSDEPAKPVLTLSRHQGTVQAVDFTKDCKHLITGGRDGTIRLWNVKD